MKYVCWNLSIGLVVRSVVEILGFVGVERGGDMEGVGGEGWKSNQPMCAWKKPFVME